MVRLPEEFSLCIYKCSNNNNNNHNNHNNNNNNNSSVNCDGPGECSPEKECL